MDKLTYTITLTETERERLYAVFGFNVDTNLKPDLKQAAADDNMDKVIRLSRQIEKDQAILTKLLDAKGTPVRTDKDSSVW